MVRCIRRVWLARWCFWRRRPSFAQTFVKKLLQSTCSQRTRAWSLAEPPNDKTLCLAWLGWGSSTTERLSELPRGTWTVKAWTYWQAPRGNFKLACLVWLLHLSKMLESAWLQVQMSGVLDDDLKIMSTPNCALNIKHNVKTTHNHFSKQQI